MHSEIFIYKKKISIGLILKEIVPAKAWLVIYPWKFVSDPISFNLLFNYILRPILNLLVF